MSESQVNAPAVFLRVVRQAARPILAFARIAALFELMLVLKWAQVINKGFVYLISGLLPWSDAVSYFAGARQLLLGFQVEPWIGKRPLFTGLLASILAVSGQNLQAAQVVLALLTAWAVFLLCRELARSYGLATSLTSLALLALYYQRFIGMTSTEHLGLSAGCLALTALIRGARTGDRRVVWAGLFLMAFALVARAGAFLVLPASLAWAAWPYRHNRRALLIVVGVGAAAIALAFGIDAVLRQLLTPGTQAFNNFSSTLYGVAVGDKGWLKVLHDHPELTQMQDYQAAPLIYRYAFEAIRAHPDVALSGVLDTWWQFFTSPDKNAFGFINTNPSLGGFPGVTLFLLCILGVASCVKARAKPSYSLIPVMLVGIVLSVPALPPVDAEFMRAYAATIPAQVVIVGLGVGALIGLIAHRRLPDPVETVSGGEIDGKIVLWSGAALVALSFVAPILFSLLIPKSHPAVAAGYAGRCPSGQETLAIYLAPGAALNLVDSKASGSSFVPDVRVADFRGPLADNLRIWTDAILIMRSFKSGQTLLTTIDERGRSVWVTIDTGSLPASGRMMVACARLNPVQPDQQLFYTVKSVLDVVR